MLYLIFGQNSLGAVKKIREIKKAFFKKNPSFLLEEIDGDDYNAPQDFGGLIENLNLFSQIRLFIFKNMFSKIYNAESFFTKYSDFLKDSKDIFLFWEHDLKNDDKIFKIFQRNSTKIQEIKIQKEKISTISTIPIFRFVDKIFVSSGAEVLLVVEEAKRVGIDAKNFVNVIFWKLKKIQKKDKLVLDLAYQAILTDLNLKMDNKNEEEHLSRFVYSIASKSAI